MATATVTSTLWKFVQLTRHSQYFPALVLGASNIRNREYSQEMLEHVAAQGAVLNAIKITIVDGVVTPIDTILESLLVSAGTAVDSVLLAGVDSFPTPPRN